MSVGDQQASNRRDFIKGASVLIGGFVATVLGLPSLAYLLSPVSSKQEGGAWIDLGLADAFEAGAPRLFEFTQTRVNGWERTAVTYGAFVVRDKESGLRVFSDVCTHLGCRVHWRAEIQHYVSPCHDGHFDILGNNVSGPPPRPLDEFHARLQEGHVYIQLPPIRRAS